MGLLSLPLRSPTYDLLLDSPPPQGPFFFYPPQFEYFFRSPSLYRGIGPTSPFLSIKLNPEYSTEVEYPRPLFGGQKPWTTRGLINVYLVFSVLRFHGVLPWSSPFFSAGSSTPAAIVGNFFFEVDILSPPFSTMSLPVALSRSDLSPR